VDEQCLLSAPAPGALGIEHHPQCLKCRAMGSGESGKTALHGCRCAGEPHEGTGHSIRSVPVTDAAEKSSHSASSILSEVDEARRAAESEAILAALNSSHWNRKQAAATLGIDYKALLYKMKKLAIGNKPPEPARPSQALRRRLPLCRKKEDSPQAKLCQGRPCGFRR